MDDLLERLLDYASGNPAAIDQARGLREGGFAPVDSSESALPNLPPSRRMLSEDALRAIILFEVSSAAYYTLKYQHPLWPGGLSGITVGVGYDLGYASPDDLQRDWGDMLPSSSLEQLGTALGKTGGKIGAAQMGTLVEALAVVTIPFEAADAVFRSRSAPLYTALTEHSLANTDSLGPDSLGALVSLVYNRGASFDNVGDRYIEMRAIRDHMQAKAFASIPDELRKMARLWPDTPGLQKRRAAEAELFARDLS